MTNRSPLFRLMDWLRAPDCRLSPTSRWVAAAIGFRMNKEGVAWPSERLLSQDTGLSEKSVQRAIKAPDGVRLVFEIERGGSPRGGTRASNTYRLKETPDKVSPVQPLTEGPRSDADRGHSVTPLLTESPLTPDRESYRSIQEESKKNPRRSSATQRKLSQLQQDPRCVEVAEAWRAAFGRGRLTLGVLEASQRALDAGYEPKDMAAVVEAVAKAKEEPGAFPRGSLIRWAAENNIRPRYVLRPGVLDDLISDLGRKRPAEVVPFDSLTFEEQDRRLSAGAGRA